MKQAPILPVRIERDSYNLLKKLAFINQRPMAEIVRDGIEMMIAKNIKVLTGNDIAV